MSKGHGRIQRQVLEVLSDEDEWIAVSDLAYLLANGEKPGFINGYPATPSSSQREAVRRACSRLEDDGLIVSKKACRRYGDRVKWVKSR